MIQRVLVVGSGSAGLLAALSLKRKIPALEVSIVRSPEIGVIGVGEGTTPNFPRFLFNFLGIPRREFYGLAHPTWKLGIRFKWGLRASFDYTFSNQLDSHHAGLAHPSGFYCGTDFSCADTPAALMHEDKAFLRQPDGSPDIHPHHGFHVENVRLVACLEQLARGCGVKFIDAEVAGGTRSDDGLQDLRLADGRILEADFFIDASGFRCELLGGILEEPFEDFGKTLFCDHAVVGGWERKDESVLPYTTAEEMDAGWSWRIEHEHHVHRGYVFSSDFISEDEATAEFLSKNPSVSGEPRMVKFRSGYRRRNWVGNVVAIGNSAGFVEPLEATALMVVCSQCQHLTEMMMHSQQDPTASMRDLYNRIATGSWREIRDFLGLHYQANSAPDTPFWRHCREETDLSGIGDLIEFYRDNGPTGFCRHSLPKAQSEFGLEGYLVHLLGNKVPHQGGREVSTRELNLWKGLRASNRRKARAGIGVAEALRYVRHPGWQWHGDGQQPGR